MNRFKSDESIKHTRSSSRITRRLHGWCLTGEPCNAQHERPQLKQITYHAYTKTWLILVTHTCYRSQYRANKIYVGALNNSRITLQDSIISLKSEVSSRFPFKVQLDQCRFCFKKHLFGFKFIQYHSFGFYAIIADAAYIYIIRAAKNI